MAFPFEWYQRFCKEVTLGAADTTKEVMPAVTDGKYVIVCVIATCLTSATQTVFVGDSSGTVKALSLAADFPAHNQAFVQMLQGLKLTLGESIVVEPAAAGPSFHVIVEGYIEREAD